MVCVEDSASTHPEGGTHALVQSGMFSTLLLYPGEWGSMYMDEIVTIISNVGFPIACAIAMFLQMDKEREAHKEESEKWVEALNKNTMVIANLTEFIKNGN